MTSYDDLVAMVSALAAELRAEVTLRPLHGTRDDSDQLIVERALGDDVRVVRIGASPSSLFLRQFIFELVDWRTIAPPNVDGSPR